MGGEPSARHGERQGDFLGGKYLLGDCLGVGGMGEVYRATNVSLGRNVAVKILNKEHTANEDDVLRFLREARAAAAVRHPNVVDVLDVARDDDGTPFIVQELLAGEDLEQYLGTRGVIDQLEAIEIMIPVADAVAAAHARDVVHRDLKPANIFLAREGNKIIPKVLDFGACLYQTVGGITARERRMLIGTPHYMAPEQITTAAEIDARADVWAMGVILWELVAGETPFEAEDANMVLKYVRTRQVPPLRRVAPDASMALEELVARCLDRDRRKRFPDAAAARAEMDEVRRELKGGASRGRIDTPDHAEIGAKSGPSTTRAPSLALKGRRMSTKRRGAALLTLTAPGDSVDPPPPSPRPRASAPPPSDRARSGASSLDLDEPGSGPDLDLDLDLEPPPPSRRSQQPAKFSSIPPVLDPRAAVSVATVSSNPPRKSERPTTPLPEPERPRAVNLAVSQSAVAPQAPIGQGPPSAHGKLPKIPSPVPSDSNKPWTIARIIGFNAWVLVPSVVAFAVLRHAPFVLAPLGRAMRGESPLACGVMAVVALVGAAALATRALAGSRGAPMMIATAGAVLLGIVMIIVTFAASESAELGVPPGVAGIVPFVAPIVPLGLGAAAWQRARSVWLSPYEKRDAMTFALLASLMVLLVLELGPVGAVHAVSGQPTSAHPTGH
ncbi:MAG: serine/threonine protein kinase [Labilithrix sp.]|nr:serine/threonine protein kinase [Labilithrix sp.]